jgi:RND family efflux transporter MFP subunit
MKRSIWLVGLAALVVVAGAATWSHWGPKSTFAQAPKQKGSGGGRVVPVEIGLAVRKQVPVRIDVLGTVTPIASVAIKTRIDSEITAVHFHDGATVKAGDLLFSLDKRSVEAQIKQVEGVLTGARAQVEQAERDVERYTELVAKNATSLVTLNNAKTQANIWRASVDSNTAQLELLKVQLGFTSIRAPIDGRVSMAAVKVGNQVRQADATPLATIIQAAPVYVTFALPQRNLPDLRQALTSGTASIQAVVPGETRKAAGQVTMIENTVDSATGTVLVRATMANADELLWPGTLVTVQLTFRQEEAVTVPPIAIQVGQSGPFVFVVDKDVARVKPVKVARVLDGESVLDSGLDGGETVVTEGQLLLTNGTRVAPRDRKAGS